MYGRMVNNPQKIIDKHIPPMNNSLEIYGACRYKMDFHQFCLSNDDTFNRPKG